MKSLIRSIIKKSFYLTCMFYILTNFIVWIRYMKGNIDTDSGTLHTQLSVEQSVAYINEVFNDYKLYSGVSQFHGEVAEIGPGDNCGVALLFLLDGVRHVDLIDRYYSKRNQLNQYKIYQALQNQYSGLEHFFGDKIQIDEDFQSIKRWYGEQASAEKFFVHHTYDYIISRAVFEHLYDPLLSLSMMIKSLRPCGMLIHKIDLRDHAMFSSYFHELKFLEVPSWIYKLMTSASGRPNRVLIQEYRNLLDKLGVKYKLLVTRLAGAGDIIPHLPYEEIKPELRKKSLEYVKTVRRKFSDSFANVRDEDLCVSGVFLIVYKD